ncbi:MAG: class I SAM-dependent methyltransferase [Micropruina sp.]|uniref:class I SAM-dependent methyltransferase n=1 Tax=Micropruina sp. TaxID=2737536 RepID=UPI0039E24F8B
MDTRHEKLAHARSFGEVADVYEAARPSYPADAVSWLVRPDEVRVVDVGAGTGKLTRALVAAGHEVTAVDPSEQMLAVLRSRIPGVQTLTGTGEQLPLPDGTADAITFAQAWHWVDPQRASVEAGRVLRPGGTLGLVWNLRDERVDWVRELGVAMRADKGQYTIGMDDDPKVAAPFGTPERTEFGWTQPIDREALLELVRSRSYFAVLDAAGQQKVLDAVRRLLDTHPQLAGREALELPYVTVAFRYRRPDRCAGATAAREGRRPVVRRPGPNPGCSESG